MFGSARNKGRVVTIRSLIQALAFTETNTVVTFGRILKKTNHCEKNDFFAKIVLKQKSIFQKY